MNNKYTKGIFCALFSAFTVGIFAQQNDQKISVTKSSGIIKVDPVKGKESSGISSFQNSMKLNSQNDFLLKKQETDQQGFTHQRYQQTYNGINVEFAKPVLHSKNGVTQTISGEYYDITNLSTTPGISAQQAFQRAIAHTGAQSYLWEDVAASRELGYERPEGELVILPVFDSRDAVTAKLAYKFTIYTIQPLGGGDLYIDAQDGSAVFFNNKVRHVDNFGHDGRSNDCTPIEEHTTEEIKNTFEAFVAGSAATRYSGTVSIETTLSGGNYTLNDASRQVYTRDANNLAPSGSSLPYLSNYSEFTDNDNNWTAAEYDNANKDNAALDAHWGAIQTYDYWSQVHNRDSYDGNGAQLRSYVHVDNDYDNAFWFLNVMSYGDGSSNGNEGNGFFDALTSIDVAAHEIGHAVTEFTANLAYQRESGGLNEGYSDIWGAAVEHFAKGNGNDAAPDASIWEIGDEIDRRSGSAALRSMSDPKSLGQPDTYGGTYWIDPNCGTPTSNNDYCGVHTNSGVLNHWFYLAVVGGSGSNDVGDSYNFSGMGMDKAAKISYRAINIYLSANSTYADARVAMIQSAIDLYGAGGIEEEAVTNAMYAINVGDAYGGGGSNGSTYCTSQGNSIADEYISRVEVGTIDNSTGASSGYTDHTNISTSLSKGVSTNITITPTWPGTVYAEGYAVWIDYNQNQSFDDSGELVFSKAASSDTSASGTFTVPTSALDGETRMRVSLMYNDIPTSCETFSYGEVEDYTVIIGGSTADTESPSVPTNLSVVATTTSTIDLSWTAATDNVAVTGYDVYQGTTNLGTVTGVTANITGLTEGTTYTFSVVAKDAAGNESAASNSVTATTDTTSTPPNGDCTGTAGAPYGESFEASLGLWSQSVNDDIDWTRDSAGTPSSNTGPSNGADGSFYMFVEASGDGTGYPNKRAMLESPCFDLSGETAATFSFDYHMYGSTDGGSVDLEASADGGTTWTSLWNQTGNQGDQWNDVSISLAAYAGATVQLRFNRVTGGTWQSDVAIDNVSLSAGNDNDDDTDDNAPSGYCTANGNNSTEEYIARVQIGGIDNTSGRNDAGYQDFTNLSTNLSGSASITITPEWPGSVYSEGYTVFVDWNRDGDFDDAGETAFTQSATQNTPVTGTITVPSGASQGLTRMRVALMYNAEAPACGSFNYGEVEDYLVNVTSSSVITGLTNQENVGIDTIDFNVFPNPVTQGVLNIDMQGVEATSISIYNLLGQTVYKGDFENTINVSRLEEGMYILEVETETSKLVKRFIKK